MSEPNKERSSPPPKAKSGCLAAVVKGLLVVVVLLLAAGLAYYLRIQSIRSAAREEAFRKDLEPPKNLALQAVQEHEESQGALGDPIEHHGQLRREGTGELDRSNARFSFDVRGSKGSAVVDAAAKQADGSWRVTEIKVKMTGGKTIDVPPPKGEAAQDLEFNL